MRTIWEQVNQDLVEYRRAGFGIGMEVGLQGRNLPPHVEGYNLDAMDPISAGALLDGYYDGWEKGIDARHALSR